jgi:hypothetical protein
LKLLMNDDDINVTMAWIQGCVGHIHSLTPLEPATGIGGTQIYQTKFLERGAIQDMTSCSNS